MAKRASMREGPLAALFSSTEESLEGEEIKIRATSPGPATPTEVVETPRRGRSGGKAKPQRKSTRTKAAPKAKAKAKPKPRPQPRVEPDPEPVSEELSAFRVEPAPADVPAPDPLPDPTPEPEQPPVSLSESAPAVREEKRERLGHLLGEQPTPVSNDRRPVYGRNEPDPNRTNNTVPRTHNALLRVVGVGGAGVNAVNRMIDAQIEGVEFAAVNTDMQSLQTSKADVRLHIGSELTRGLGAGADPRVGYHAAWEEQDRIKQLLKGSDMVFVTAGAGGGTGTGAGPVVAKLARDAGALTVGVVTKPFAFEGARRAAQAEEGVAALGAEVDTMIVVPNERLLQILERQTSMVDAFGVADDVLRQAVQGISDLVMLPGLINLDFADVRTTMVEAGDAILGIGMGTGEHRALHAAEKAVSSPLLETSVEGSRAVLLSITGGPDLSLIETSEAARVVQEAAHPDANIIFGSNIDEDLGEEVWVTVIATRFDSSYARRFRRESGRTLREPRGPERSLEATSIPEFTPGR